MKLTVFVCEDCLCCFAVEEDLAVPSCPKCSSEYTNFVGEYLDGVRLDEEA